MDISRTSTSLLRRVRAGEQTAWTNLADLYGPLVFHWCRVCGLPAQDSADVMQEVFASVHDAISRFQHDPARGSFRGWLWTITRNQVRYHQRRSAKGQQATGGTEAFQAMANVPAERDSRWDNENGSDPATPLELARFVHRGLELVRAEFGDKIWAAFWRSAVEQQATADIADDLGMSQCAVRQAKSRVLRRLRDELGDDR